MVKSRMRNRIGLCAHLAKSSSFRISSSTVVIVPKKTVWMSSISSHVRCRWVHLRKPCSFITHVWDPTCCRNARCDLGRRTVDVAVEPLKTVRMAFRRLFWTTKKIHARTIPNSSPMTKSQLMVSFEPNSTISSPTNGVSDQQP
jgi:hypothetical protein